MVTPSPPIPQEPTAFTARASGVMSIAGRSVRCALGRGGVCDAAVKREGDGCTPAGLWPLRRVLWRPDRALKPRTALPISPIRQTDGWCDDPADSQYNRLVALPFRARAERLWRDDHVYDVVVVLGHNDDPVMAGNGSAIFLHLAQPGYSPTEGCVAINSVDMLSLLAVALPGDLLSVVASPDQT
jgi:L,D-peptidoglycan transpeptidase YkuD (ErfK/YbiS/YcfS/YnhG family)